MTFSYVGSGIEAIDDFLAGMNFSVHMIMSNNTEGDDAIALCASGNIAYTVAAVNKRFEVMSHDTMPKAVAHALKLTSDGWNSLLGKHAGTTLKELSAALSEVPHVKRKSITEEQYQFWNEGDYCQHFSQFFQNSMIDVNEYQHENDCAFIGFHDEFASNKQIDYSNYYAMRNELIASGQIKRTYYRYETLADAYAHADEIRALECIPAFHV